MRNLATLGALVALTFLPPLAAPLRAQDPAAEVQQLGQSLLSLYEQGRYAEAVPLARRIVAALRARPALNHPDYALVLNALAGTLAERGENASAEPLFLEALEILRRSVGEDNAEFAIILANLATVQFRSGQPQRAEARLRDALAIWRHLQPDDISGYAGTLASLATLLSQRGDDPAAVPLYRELLDLLRRTVGTGAEMYSDILVQLAEALERTGELAGAEMLYRELVEIQRGLVGERHHDYARALDKLTFVLYQRGAYTAAEPFLRQALEIYRRTGGEETEDYATVLGHLGLSLSERGDQAAAVPVLGQLVELRRRTVGQNDPEYARALSYLATALSRTGDFQRAEALYREALEIRRRTIGEEHRDYALTLSNLASVLRERGELEGAVESLRQAAEVWRRVLGDVHPNYALALDNLGMVLRDAGYPAEALLLARRALAIRRQALGEDHPVYATSLNNLATLLFDQGELAAAEPLFQQALRLTARTLGEDHPEYSKWLLNLAALNQALGRPDSSLAMAERALRIEQRTLEQVFGFTSERGMLAYTATLHSSLSGLLSMAAAQGSDAAGEAALRWVLLRKGVVLSALSSYRRVERLAAEDAQLGAGIARLHATRERLSQLALTPPAGVAGDSLAHMLLGLKGERDRLEAEISRSLSARIGARGEAAGAVDLEAVRGVLPTGSALVEFVRYDQVDFGREGRKRRPPEPRYAALVLRRDATARWVELGEAAEIERWIEALRQAHEQGKDVGLYRAAAAELFPLLFEPLEDALAGVEALVLSLDGELNRVPVGALVDREGRYLIERYRIGYVSNGRDLLKPTGGTRGTGTEVFAGPRFDAAPRAAKGAAAPHEAGQRRTPIDQARGVLRGGQKWEELPGARAEATDVRKTLEKSAWGPVRVSIGADATEAAFKAVKSPRVLHVATHGFFVPEREMTPQERARCLEGVGAGVDLESGAGRGTSRLACVEDPLLRSGIVLSGANAVGNPGAEGEDGWVLAEEIAVMELAGTELVVLSACETGLGDVQVGEGVYGLRRAFELAGARQVLMSLYKVPDVETRELLAAFYRRLAKGASAEEALRASQLELQKKKPHPLYWGSFVVVGRP